MKNEQKKSLLMAVVGLLFIIGIPTVLFCLIPEFPRHASSSRILALLFIFAFAAYYWSVGLSILKEAFEELTINIRKAKI